MLTIGAPYGNIICDPVSFYEFISSSHTIHNNHIFYKWVVYDIKLWFEIYLCVYVFVLHFKRTKRTNKYALTDKNKDIDQHRYLQ